MENQKSGIISKWNPERGFGFIRLANGRDHFMHISQWLSDEAPAVGVHVLFELGSSINPTKGPQAVNVSIEKIDTGRNALKAGV